MAKIFYVFLINFFWQNIFCAEFNSSHADVRPASHAGSWYNDDDTTLFNELKSYLSAADTAAASPSHQVKAIVVPHAGYTYCGATAAHAWKAVDFSNVKTVFLLGPSHFTNITGLALPPPSTASYDTPFGDIKLDTQILSELRILNLFKNLSAAEDAREHSLEMMLPFLRMQLKDRDDVTIIPILVGVDNIGNNYEAFVNILLKYFQDKSTLFVISSDFCHWGKRFDYFYLDPEFPKQPIYKAIEAMDKKAANFIEQLDREGFDDYVKNTNISICGHNAISILLQLVQRSDASKFYGELIHYSQSNPSKSVADSSVSYAAIKIVQK